MVGRAGAGVDAFGVGAAITDSGLADVLASYADVYVDDAFGASHRAHASISGIPARVPGYAGLLLTRELEVLGRQQADPARPYVAVLGGAKVSGKLKVHFPSPLGNHKNIHYLTPGKELLVNRNSWEFEFKPFDAEKVAGWKEGVILLEDAGMKELIDLLERWYGVDIQVFGTPKSPWKINGRYQNEKLEDILIGLEFVYGIDYQINGKNVLIKIKD
jgi:hypothetical protein